LKDDELEEGFPIDRATQTKCSGVYMRNFATLIDCMSVCLFVENIYTGDNCAATDALFKCTQTIITDLYRY